MAGGEGGPGEGRRGGCTTPCRPCRSSRQPRPSLSGAVRWRRSTRSGSPWPSNRHGGELGLAGEAAQGRAGDGEGPVEPGGGRATVAAQGLQGGGQGEVGTLAAAAGQLARSIASSTRTTTPACRAESQPRVKACWVAG